MYGNDDSKVSVSSSVERVLLAALNPATESDYVVGVAVLIFELKSHLCTYPMLR